MTFSNSRGSLSPTEEPKKHSHVQQDVLADHGQLAGLAHTSVPSSNPNDLYKEPLMRHRLTDAAGPLYSHTDYTVACICPMGVELAPVEAMLDEIHSPLPTGRDQNAYTLGEIGVHKIVIAIMPETGNNAAATTATQLLNDFPSIRFGLLVGIGGGVPSQADIRLGDIVVSKATSVFGGVIQYDLGKWLEGGQFQRTGAKNKPPALLNAKVQKLISQYRRLGQNLMKSMKNMFEKYPEMQQDYSFPITEPDKLFLSSYQHHTGSSCDECDDQQVLQRLERSSKEPRIHYGNIGSANAVVKDATLRDSLG